MLFFVALFSFFGLTAEASWTHEPLPGRFLDLNPLEFTNRASCALDSKKPTKSFFILADSLNAGKVLYRIGQNLGKDNSFSVEGVRRYRYAVYSLAQLVANRLLKGDLPLLQAGQSDFDRALSECSGEGACLAMDQLVQNYWTKASSSEIKMMSQVGSYARCHSLKSFSPLEAHLYGVKPDVQAFSKLAQAVHQSDDILQDCGESLVEEDLKVGVYQIDLRNVSDDEWEKRGFIFWNSFKLYYSWAYRYAPEMKELSGIYLNVLKKVALEESVLFFPNGCRSMVAPECGRDYLSLSSLRSLAQSQNNAELSKLDYFEVNAQGPSTGVNHPVQPSVNNDVLDLADYSSAADWANNFRENIMKTRGFMKIKFTKSASTLSLVRSKVGATILKSLEDHTAKVRNLEDKKKYADELYVLCSEYRIALDAQTSFLKSDLEVLKGDKRLNGITALITEESVDHAVWMTEELGPKVLAFCGRLEQERFWEESGRPNNGTFAPWYQDYVFNTRTDATGNLKLTEGLSGKPYFIIQNGRPVAPEDNVFCSTPVHCARRALGALVDLKGFSEYASGFLSFDDSVKSPDLFNPMSERVACRSYDPWFKTKKTVSDLVQDLFMTAVSSLVPSPVYVDFNLREKQVVSFKELMKDGKVYYDPQFDKKRLQATLIADFGPLLGAPCAVSISGNKQQIPSYLALDGITLQACHGGEKNTLTAYGPDDISNATKGGSGCFSCTLQLSSIASSASAYSPGLRPFVFLIRGVVRLIRNLRDPHDIPKSWQVDPNTVYRSWRKFGDTKSFKSCRRKLLKGKECLEDRCEANLVSSFENTQKKYVSSIVVERADTAVITVKGSKQKFGARVPRFSCASKTYEKDDFFELEVSP